MIDFDTRTLKIKDKFLIKNGKPVNDYLISENDVTFEDIECLYAIYETSFPDQRCMSLFRAKPENQLSLSEIVYGEDRSVAQQRLEQTLLEAIISHKLIYPDNDKWFWQSQKNKNLIIPRWIFTQECHRTVTYQSDKSDKNELWDRNIVGRRLRKSMNKDARNDTCFSNMTIKECLTIIKEEISERDETIFFTNDVLNDILMKYMDSIPKKQNKKKAKIGQLVSRIRNAKTPLYKIRAIDALLENANCNTVCKSEKWYKAYKDFVDYRTLMFIKEFIPHTDTIEISGNIADYTETYITCNSKIIHEYVITH